MLHGFLNEMMKDFRNKTKRMKNILMDFQKDLESEIKIRRKKHLEKIGTSEQELSSTFSKGIILSEEAKKLGLHYLKM